MLHKILITFIITASVFAKSESKYERIVTALCSDDQQLKYTPCFQKDEKEEPKVSNFSDDGVKILAKFNKALVSEDLSTSSLKEVCRESRRSRKRNNLKDHNMLIAINNLGETVPSSCLCSFRGKRIKESFCSSQDNIKKISTITKAKAYSRIKKLIKKSILEHREINSENLSCPSLSGFDVENYNIMISELKETNLESITPIKDHDPTISILNNLSPIDQNEIPKNYTAPLIKSAGLVKHLYKKEHGVEPSEEIINNYMGDNDLSTRKSLELTYPKAMKDMNMDAYMAAIKKAGSVEAYYRSNLESVVGAPIEIVEDLGLLSGSNPLEMESLEAAILLTKGINRYLSRMNNNKLISLINTAVKNNRTLEEQISFESKELDSCKNIQTALDSFNDIISREDHELLSYYMTTRVLETNIDKEMKLQGEDEVTDKDVLYNFSKRGECFQSFKNRNDELLKIDVDSLISAKIINTDREVSSIVHNEVIINNFIKSSENVREKLSKINDSKEKDEIIESYNDYADDFYQKLTGRPYKGGFDIQNTPIASYGSLIKSGSKLKYISDNLPEAKDLIIEKKKLEEELKNSSPIRRKEIQDRINTINKDLKSFENNGMDIEGLTKSLFPNITETDTIVAESVDSPDSTSFEKKGNVNPTPTRPKNTVSSNVVSNSIAPQTQTSNASGNSPSTSTTSTNKDVPKETRSVRPREVFVLKSQDVKKEVEKVISVLESSVPLIIYDEKTDSLIKQIDDKVLWSYDADLINTKFLSLDKEDREVVMDLLEKRNRFKTKNLNQLLNSKN